MTVFGRPGPTVIDTGVIDSSIGTWNTTYPSLDGRARTDRIGEHSPSSDPDRGSTTARKDRGATHLVRRPRLRDPGAVASIEAALADLAWGRVVSIAEDVDRTNVRRIARPEERLESLHDRVVLALRGHRVVVLEGLGHHQEEV